VRVPRHLRRPRVERRPKPAYLPYQLRVPLLELAAEDHRLYGLTRPYERPVLCEHIDLLSVYPRLLLGLHDEVRVGDVHYLVVAAYPHL
jgi:hypothetical protein